MEKYEQVWQFIHPEIQKVSQKLFADGHFMEAVRSAFVEIEKIVKNIVIKKTTEEKITVDLMFSAFSPKNTLIELSDLTGKSKDNVQEGFMHIFAGSMMAIRNPKAHDNLDLPPEKAIHFIFLASLLMMKLDDAEKIEANKNK